MQDIAYIDETFDLNYTSEYHLSIQLGLDGFSFCVLDTIQKKYVALQHHSLIASKSQFLAQKVKAIFDSEEKLNQHYKSVLVDFSTQKATLVPDAFFDSRHALQLLSTNFDTERNEQACTCRLDGFDQVLVFAYPQDLNDFFQARFTDYQLRHKSCSLIQTALEQSHTDRKTLIIHFEKKFFRIIVLNRDRIDLYNSFYYKTEADFLFHTLNICKQLDIDAENDEILIGGFTGSDSSFVRQLRKYFLQIRFLKPTQALYYSYTLSKTPEHYFATLLNSYTCV